MNAREVAIMRVFPLSLVLLNFVMKMIMGIILASSEKDGTDNYSDGKMLE